MLSAILLPHMSFTLFDAVLAADHAACALLLPLCMHFYLIGQQSCMPLLYIHLFIYSDRCCSIAAPSWTRVVDSAKNIYMYVPRYLKVLRSNSKYSFEVRTYLQVVATAV